MPWKLLMYLIVLGIVLAFIGLNLGNTTDISLGFTTFEAVPVFMSLFAAFFFGVILTIPLVMQSVSRKHRHKGDLQPSRREVRQLKKQQKQEAKEEKAIKKAEKAEKAEIH